MGRCVGKLQGRFVRSCWMRKHWLQAWRRFCSRPLLVRAGLGVGKIGRGQLGREGLGEEERTRRSSRMKRRR